MAELEWNTLKEAAEYLIGKTGQQWTERCVLDAALKVYKPRPNGHAQPTRIRAAPPIKTRFALYCMATQLDTAVTSPFIRRHDMPWRTIPLYPKHIFELLACGETEVGIVGSSSDDSWLKENEYVWIEPLEHSLLVNLAMVGITREALRALLFAIDSMEKRRGIETPNATPTIKNTEAIIGLPKRKVMAAFQGIKWDYEHWGKNLAAPSKKLESCRVARGSKKASALWSPVDIGLYLLDEGEQLKKIDAVFVDLKDWTDEWQEKTELERD